MMRFTLCAAQGYGTAGVLVASLTLTGCASFSPSFVKESDSFLSAPVADTSRLPSPWIDDAPSRRLASRDVLASDPFGWQTSATTDVGSPIQTVTVGQDGFRTLVIGSISGHDPAAIRLTEDLAHYLYGHQMILGGVEVTVIRTLNPDGLRSRKQRNAEGLYLNRLFTDSSIRKGAVPAEVRFVVDYFREKRPQRVIHIRTVAEERGMILANDDAAAAARETGNWFGCSVKSLPQAAREGTLEAYLSKGDFCDVITVGIPRGVAEADAWALYGDGLVSLLLDGTSKSRDVARNRSGSRSADGTPPRGHSDSGVMPDLGSHSAVQDLPQIP